MYRTKQRLIAGVCGGIGVRLGVDPWLPRVAFLLALWYFGAGLWFYLLLWWLLPEEQPC